MNHFLYSLVVVVPALLLCMITHYVMIIFMPDLIHYNPFFYLCAGVFGIVTWIIIILGQRTVNHSNKTYFSWVSLFSVFVKLAIGVLLVVLYQRQAEPEGYLFITPFFVTYLIFTIAEIIGLHQIISKSKKT